MDCRRKSMLLFVSLSLLLSACGSKDKSSSKDDAAEARSCSINVNGSQKRGSSKAECEALEKEYAQSKSQDQKVADNDASSTDSVAACSYNINGKIAVGQTKQDCDRLAEVYQQNGDASEKIAETSSADVYSCSFSVNGVNKTGSSKTECDKLRDEFGIPKI